MAFEKFINRVVINAKLVAVTPLYIGARTDSIMPSDVNGSFVKDVYGRPYIPGSSLKGVLRAFLTSVMEEPTISDVEKEFGRKEKRDKFDNPEKLAKAIACLSTPVEMLFGSTVMAGKVKIADAMPVDERITPDIRNGVAIERDTHTAYGGALFNTETMPSGTSFRFIASAENLVSEEAFLFGKLIEYFADGNITVGGRSRAGLGNIELRDVDIKIYRMGKDGFPVSEAPIRCGTDEISEVISNVCKIAE